jgi:DNA mismatch repair protein MutS
MGLTPMMQQYLKMHDQVPDCILLFRVGDFFETFFDDAITASKVLEIALTGKQCGLDEPAPMCGVPHHAAEPYIAKLVEKGYKVAVCEQMEDPALAKGLVKREIIKVITPGTITSDGALKAKENNYLAALYGGKNDIGLAYVDLTTGDFRTTEIPNAPGFTELLGEIGKINPAEIILSSSLYKQSKFVEQLKIRFNCMTSLYGDVNWKLDASRSIVKAQFHVFALDALGLKDHASAVRASGALLNYIKESQKKVLTHINHVVFYKTSEYMLLDLSTRRNLELTETLRRGEKYGSLLWVLDQTTTAMGGRMLRQWIEAPLIDCEKIQKRQDFVEELVANPGALQDFKSVLSKIYDLERICGKIAFGTVNPKDMLSLKQSLRMLPAVKQCIYSIDAPKLQAAFGEADDLDDIYQLIQASIADDAPFVLKDGGVIKDGFNSEIDQYREAQRKGKDWLRYIESREKEATGIKSLKVKYNRVFGYFIEVTKSNLDLVPERYIRKQTLANSERFFTPELKEIETKILGAQQRLSQLEYQIFSDIRQKIMDEIKRIQKRAHDVAYLDALYSLAAVAVDNHYVKPEIAEDGVIELYNSRHPVAEKLMDEGTFVSNDCLLDLAENRMMLITGPNMAGKSTYIRQVAVITLMAQMGSFVPADSAHIGICDRIFTRIGASDDLTTGQSTFMVEMSEVSNILKNATQHSLVILDEIGRGTSTFDGVSIAWAVAEYLSNPLTVGARTLFATHYHELTQLENQQPGIKNLSIGLKETPDGVVFLRKIRHKPADQSYGIEVAQLAGFPQIVTQRAKVILRQLEKMSSSHGESQEISAIPLAADGNRQMSFYGDLSSKPPASSVSEDEQGEILQPEEKAVLAELYDADLNDMTPLQALNLLNDLKTKLQAAPEGDREGESA